MPSSGGSAGMALADRTVGVVERCEAKMQPGYTLFNVSRETYLIDEDGRLVNEWRSSRVVFCSYLRPNGHLLRDGSENAEAPCFQAGGAAGWVEEVTWDNELVWSFAPVPYTSFLSHHDLEPLPNGNVLLNLWERMSKEKCLAAGRRPDLMPDGEVWNDVLQEITPDGEGGAKVVWRWSMWDHLVQDFDPACNNYGEVAAHPELFDINYCPPGGKVAERNRLNGRGDGNKNVSGLTVMEGKGETGEKDWLHINAVSYDAVRDQVVMSINLASEFIIIDHGTTAEEARGHSGGKRGKGGDILYRFGNPMVSRQGSRNDQVLYAQHSVHFLRGVPGEGNILLFNNGRAPDRLWSTVDEFSLPDSDGEYPRSLKAVSREPVWRYGPPVGRRGSFYSTHISGCQRLPNGNTLITLGNPAILIEVTCDGEEVWRYISPVMFCDGGVAVVRQGDQRTHGRFSLFRALRYDAGYSAFLGSDGKPRSLAPGRYLEA